MGILELNKNMKIDFEFSSTFLDAVERNSSFDVAKLRIAYTGKNRNNTFISKKAFEAAIPTMYNCPVVANYMREENEIGSHDGEFIDTDDGVKYVNITEPVGIIPESAEWYWDTVEEDGSVHEYLCTDVCLWKRQEAYLKIKENGITKQSMEIEVEKGEMLDGCYNIQEFTFTAFCLLGTAEPCFESAALFTFEQKEDFKEQYTEMLKEFKLAFSDTNNANEELNDNQKGGKSLEKLKELLEKYNVTKEDLKFEYEELSDEELEEKFAEEFEADDSNEEVVNNSENNSNEDFALNSQIEEAIHAAVRDYESIEREWGPCPRFWVVDFDIENKEVYFHDWKDNYKLCGCSFEMNGDDVIVDFENIKRKKYQIVDYVEGSSNEDYSLAIHNLVNELDTKYSTLVDGIELDKKELERLKSFEAEVLAERRTSEENELFDKFNEKLKDNEEFKQLKEKSVDYTLDELEKELYAIVGKMDFALETEKKNTKPSVGFENENTMDEDEASMRALFSNAGIKKEEK